MQRFGRNLQCKYFGALAEKYVTSEVMYVCKKLRSYLQAIGRRQVRSASPSDSWALA